MKDDTWINKIADKIIDVIDERIKKPGESYSAMAKVIKVDKTEGTAWVAIPGGNPETPAALSIDCQAGDTVQVYVSGHKATLTGNMTAPPTDDTTAFEVKEEVKRVGKTVDFYVTEVHDAQKEAEAAQQTADGAMTAANGKNKVYVQATMPTGGEYIENDTWFDTANDNKIYHWKNNQWTASLLGDDALDTFSANHIVAGTIDASQVTISNLDAGSISSGKVAAQYIDAEHLKIGDMINDAGFITDAEVPTWYTGTAITGTDTTPHTVSGSGIANAIIGDMYLNTSTNYVYQCTYGGTPSQALWKYVGDIEGEAGRGISSISKTGTSGNIDTYTITYSDGSASTYTVTNGTDVTSQYVTTISGKTGIAVHMANDTSNYALMNSNGLYVYKGGDNVAFFGSYTILGDVNGYNAYFDSSGVGFRNGSTTRFKIAIRNDGTAYFVNDVDIYGDFTANSIDCGALTVNSKDSFKVISATGTDSISNGGEKSITCTGTIPSGYIPIGVISVETNHNFSEYITRFVLTSSGASVTIHNAVSGTGSTSFTVTAKILCTALQTTTVV